ncbi:unnamed protein product, partial [Dicrocoelium dendriticum]
MIATDGDFGITTSLYAIFSMIISVASSANNGCTSRIHVVSFSDIPFSTKLYSLRSLL